jgi:nucleotide-binding universal stress UspA family protein
MKKILIALDYDPLAEKVAETGYKIAKAFNAQVLLLHVLSEPVFYSSTEYSPIMGFVGFTSPEQYNVADYLKNEAVRFLEESKKHLADESIAISVLEGDFSDTIISAANEFKADLIVLGTHSRKGLDRVLMGNLAEKILHTASIPVLAIPADTASEKK